jgi:hypothetical protein
MYSSRDRRSGQNADQQVALRYAFRTPHGPITFMNFATYHKPP